MMVGVHRLLVVFVSLILLVGAFFSLAWLPIRSVAIVGDYAHVDGRKLQSALAGFIHQPLGRVDLPSLVQRLRRVPWVGQVDAQRSWPSALVVTIHEPRPWIRWGYGHIIDPHGRVFNVGDNRELAPLLLMQAGADQRVDGMTLYRLLAAPLQAAKLEIRTLSVDARNDWSVTLSDGEQWVVGHAKHGARALHFLRYGRPYLLAHHVRLANKHVDLRYVRGFALATQTH